MKRFTLGLTVKLLVGIAVAGLLTACDPPPEWPPGGEPSSFSFHFSSYDYLSGGSSPGSVAMRLGPESMGYGVVTITGELLVVPQGGSLPEKVFTIELEVDEANAQVSTVFPLDLPQLAYDFYFLLHAPNSYYGGELTNRLIVSGGLNTISISISPLVGFTGGNVRDLRRLAGVAVQYDPARVGSYANPRVGLAVDGSRESVYAVKVDETNPQIMLFLPPGEHNVQARFLDGAIQRDATLDGHVTLSPTDTEPAEVATVPVTAEATYTYYPAGGGPARGVFAFTVPALAINQAGGAATAVAVASVVGAENGLAEASIPLEAVNNADGTPSHYAGEMELTNFVPAPITWQLRIGDGSNGDLVAYCALDADPSNTSEPDHASYLCDLNVLDRSLKATQPDSAVQVTVNGPNGLVGGAVVLLNGKPLGIAGGGGAGEPQGTLSAFVPTRDDNKFQAVDAVVDPFGSRRILQRQSESVGASTTDGFTTPVALVLPAFPYDAPTITGVTPRDGARDVTLDSSIAVTFNHAMDTGATGAAFQISPAVSGQIGWNTDGTALTFRPELGLAALTNYTISFDRSAADTVGSGLVGKTSFSFTTGALPDHMAPYVVEVTPAAGKGDVDVLSHISVRFSEPMDPKSFTAGVFSVSPAAPGVLEWSGGNTVLTLKPSAALAYSTQYTVAVSAQARDLAQNMLKPEFSSVFTTGEEPDTVRPTVISVVPEHQADNVTVDATIVVTFSEPMNTASVESAFNVVPDVSRSYQWDDHNQKVTVTPAASLEDGRLYRVVIGGAAQDLARNEMGSDFESEFRTVPAPPSPTVIELRPGRFTHPRRFDDDFHDVTERTVVRVPERVAVRLAQDANGNPIGDPDRYLLVLELGEVRCVYLAGNWDRYLDGFFEDFFERIFSSPVCDRGYRAGSEVTIEPYQPRSGSLHFGGDEEEDPNFRRNRSEIKARVLTSSPHFTETRVLVTIDVVSP